MNFRYLKADEIDCRVAQVNNNGCSLLLYKDARVDMNILDETVGALNWKREHTRDNANCIVSIWDEKKNEWISKEDTGTESYSEKEKGLASDSFKRACVNWGIGRELYTAPFIWISDKSYIREKDGKKKVVEEFKVKNIEIINGVIEKLSIVDSKNKLVYSFESCKKSNNELTEDKKKVDDKARKEKAIKAICENSTEDESNFVEGIVAELGLKGLHQCSIEQLKMIYKKQEEYRKNKKDDKDIENQFN